MQLVYSTASADWADMLLKFEVIWTRISQVLKLRNYIKFYENII